MQASTSKMEKGIIESVDFSDAQHPAIHIEENFDSAYYLHTSDVEVAKTIEVGDQVIFFPAWDNSSPYYMLWEVYRAGKLVWMR